MTTNAVYHLSNLSIEQEFDLTVAEGADVMAAAQAHLEESGLHGDMQKGFYISVYPRTPDDPAPVDGAGFAVPVGSGASHGQDTVGSAGSAAEDTILA